MKVPEVDDIASGFLFGTEIVEELTEIITYLLN